MSTPPSPKSHSQLVGSLAEVSVKVTVRPSAEALNEASGGAPPTWHASGLPSAWTGM